MIRDYKERGFRETLDTEREKGVTMTEFIVGLVERGSDNIVTGLRRLESARQNGRRISQWMSVLSL